MKISELNTQSFLGGTNVPANSYVLINYADSANGTPITKKVSVQELGKAIANDLQLYKKTQDGAVTTSVSSGAYVNGTAQQLITAAEKANLDAINITMRNGDSAPELTLTKSINVSKVITNNDNPVVYDVDNDTLQYVDGANGPVNISIGGESDSDQFPKAYFDLENKKLLYYYEESTYDLHMGGDTPVVYYDTTTQKLQYYDDQDSLQEIPALGGNLELGQDTYYPVGIYADENGTLYYYYEMSMFNLFPGA